MACEGCNNSQHGTALERVFDGFWPKGMPFPPMAPYLAAAVSRQQALDWAKAIGADSDPGVVSGDSMAILDLVGKAMMDPAGTYSTQRSERKKKDTTPSPDDRCRDACIAECGSLSNCSGLGVDENGMCHYTCVDRTGPATGDPSSPSTTQTT